MKGIEAVSPQCGVQMWNMENNGWNVTESGYSGELVEGLLKCEISF